jgi:hypothetical protein
MFCGDVMGKELQKVKYGVKGIYKDYAQSYN